MIFPITGNNEKKIFKEKRKKKKISGAKIWNGLLPILYCEEEIILQDFEVYCNRLGSAIVLQYNYD